MRFTPLSPTQKKGDMCLKTTTLKSIKLHISGNWYLTELINDLLKNSTDGVHTYMCNQLNNESD